MENHDRCFRVDALHRNTYNATCAVKMLLIQALRVGAVAAKSWSELQAQTLGRADKTVQWTTPDHPVIPALIGHSAYLDLAKPAIVQQPLRNIHAMALKAQFVNKFRVHDLRHGVLADLAHLDDQSKIRGHASLASAASVGHKMSTFMADTTESYIGGSDASTWTLRAESS
jgi:integrase